MQSNLSLREKLDSIPLDLWFYDFEVFDKFWCVSFYNLKTNEIVVIENDFAKLSQFYHHKLKGFLGGYNNVRFDDFLLKETLLNNNPNKITDWIINQKQPGWKWSPIKYSKLKVWTFDVMDLIGTGRFSLKLYEAFLGLAIKESSVPFDFPDKLSREQIDAVVKYNIYDVKATAYLFCKFIDQFFIKIKLIDDYRLDKSFLAKTDSQITSKILNANSLILPRYQKYNFKCHPNIRVLFQKLAPNWEWIIAKFEAVQYTTKFSKDFAEEQIAFSVKLRDLTCEFKSGGLHAAINNYISTDDENLLMIDIVQNYGNLIVKYNLGSRAAPNMGEKLQTFMDKRASAKARKDTITAEYLKTLTVRPFGSMDYAYNELWDPQMRQSICITGQLIIFLLAVLLEPYATLIQINTDGILLKVLEPKNVPTINKIIKGWEKITKMDLEQVKYSKVIQKDVNSYILIDDINSSKNWKTKGAGVKYFKEQFHQKEFNKVRGSVNNNLTVLDECVVNYFTKNIPVMETLKSIKELIRFQFVFEVKGNYTTLFYGNKQMPPQKVWRIFYTKKGQPVFKSYLLEGNVWKKDKVPRSSELCTIFNGNIQKITTDDIDIDYEYYEILANEIINLYTTKKADIANFQTYPGQSYECGFCSASLLNERVVRVIYEKEICRECYLKN